VQVINLGNGRPFLLKDFISLVEKAVGKEVCILTMSAIWPAVGGGKKVHLSTQKLSVLC